MSSGDQSGPSSDVPGGGVAAPQSDAATDQRLASFPEQNPNLVIEADLDGRVTYLNPVAAERFGTLQSLGFEHPLLRDLDPQRVAARLRRRVVFRHEVAIASDQYPEGGVFEMKVCLTPDGRLIRIYAHDITAIRRAEEAVERLAEQRKRLMERLVHAQEEERRRLSGELHDEAGQALTVLRMSLELLRGEIAERAGDLQDDVSDLIELVRQTHDRLRTMAHDLRPPALDVLGLDAALQELCRSVSARVDVDITYRGDEVPDVSDAHAMCLYRFLQEALTNVVRHADADRVRVTLRSQPDLLQLTVEDDGAGMSIDPTETSVSQQGMGLDGMQQRLTLVGGRMDVQSSPDRGTRVRATLPLDGGAP